MKFILLTLALASLSLGACKHRNKNKCACDGKAVVASPVPQTSGYIYHK